MTFRNLLFALLTFPASVAAAPKDTLAYASRLYTYPSLTSSIFIGGNYRELWSLPVTVRIFDKTEEKGGLTATKLGGGMQTKSLRLKDKNGGKWVLRTIDKTVDKAMESEGIRSPFIKNVTQQMISAANPYGALTVPPMATALGLLTADPELVFVPEYSGLGKFSPVFANKMCQLERRDPVFYEEDSVTDTEIMLKDIRRNPEHEVDARMMLQARLLDMLIGDWDRHGGNWKWEYHRTANGVVIFPIPVDHDQAYFNSNGLLVKMVRPFKMRHLVGYDKRGRRIKTLNRKAWAFDAQMLGSLSKQDWEKGIRKFQQRLSNDVLEEAARRLPPEAYRMYGEELYSRLKSRRDAMAEHAMGYYGFLMEDERQGKGRK